VKIRAERLGVQDSSLLVLAETELESVLARLDEARPQLVIVDSIQMMQLAALASAPGSISQVRECGAALVRFAKRTGAAVFVIGHVTKEGAIAGPRVLEHMVDTVLYFEGDLEGEYRVLRATKNRFGPVREIGVFSMEGEGLREVSNPSERLWARNRDEVSGSIAFPALEGSRVLLVEIQAIAAPSGLASPTRRVAGVDPNRLSLLAAVLEKKLGMTLWKNDLFVNVVGGIQASEPASDLAVCLTIVSSLLDRPLPAGTAAAGEVGLSGEVRPIPRPDLRAAEAARLGLRRIVLPPESAGKADPGSGLEVVPSASLAEAVEATLGR
jgi:DNA repair protein RadA/Sms